jgi:hypothetical protein
MEAWAVRCKECGATIGVVADTYSMTAEIRQLRESLKYLEIEIGRIRKES